MFQSALLSLLNSYERVEQELDGDTRLNENRRQFVEKYNPAVLKRLRGTELLHLWHGEQNGSGMIYDLEFGKLTQGMGSISGGSAAKFKVYRGSDGLWKKKGKGRGGLSCTEDEAIFLTEEMADDLVQGCSWTRDFDLETGDPTGWQQFFERLQGLTSPLDEGLDSNNSPTLLLGWAHKYLALLFPNIFSYHHRAEQLASHLVHLGVWPDGATEFGRYQLDYVWQQTRHAVTELQLLDPLLLMHAMYEDEAGFGYGPNYWRIGTTNSQNESIWPLMKSGHYVSIGWDELGDLESQLEGLSGKAASEHVKNLLKQRRDTYAHKSTGKHPNEITSFYEDILVGDRVIAMQGKQLLGAGVITSKYYYEQSDRFHHRHSVDWHWLSPNDDGEKWDHISILYSTVYNFRENWEAALDIESRIQANPPIQPSPVLSIAAADPTPETVPVEPPLLDAHCERVYDVLKRKGQIILHGPPGTGKTYLARRAAREIIAREAMGGRDWASLDEGQRAQVDVHIAFCTFHPAYTYEEFIEGFRPELTPQGASFKRKDGLFLEVCQQAEKTAAHVVFIIDEINRANISAVMGELLTLLESDKRGVLKVRLPLSRRDFTVPANLWIIGTMNTADRSIALLDTALRRRFGFLELMPEPERLDTRVEGLHLGALLREINARIRRHVPRNSRSLQVGHSYFLHGGRPLATRNELLQVMRDDIFPLLAEYCFEDYEALAQILGEEIVDTENAIFRDEVQQRGDLLITALYPLISESLEETADEGIDSSTGMDRDENEDDRADLSLAANDAETTNQQGQD